MSKLIVKTSTEEAFFKRGRELARKLDQGRKIPAQIVISFEDPAEMMALVTATRLALFRAVKEAPGSSITQISQRLHRDRSAVKRDVDALERAGLLRVDEKISPGHGRMKEVRATALAFSLQANVA